MKKIFSTLLFLVCALCIYGQSIKLSFTAKDSRTNDYITLDNIDIDNLTIGCDTVLIGSIPKLVLPFYVGIHENNLAGHSSLKVMPNPFYGTAIVTIHIQSEGKLHIILSDITGKSVAEYNNYFVSGFHQFEIAANGSGILILHAYNGKESQSIKLINTASGTDRNYIKYLGSTRGELKSTLSSNNSGFLFNKGDQLQYTASALGYYSTSILDSPKYNAVYTFLMDRDIFPPSVNTAITTVTSPTAATSGGTITADGGSEVTVRGVCWSTSHNPTANLSTKTSDGAGTGSFTSNITGLTIGTAYYVRAYATNSAGTGYGDEVLLTTPTLPSVSTETTTATAYTAATSGGTVTSDGGSEVIVRGVCWSTSSNPTIYLNTKTTDGTGTGSFTSNITGLKAGTTYYVRAYAINNAGTAYGADLEFTTPEYNNADWEGKVMTVRGLIPADSMGITLPHEHVLIVHKGDDRDLTDEALAITELGYYISGGGKTVTEVSNIGIGRNPEGLKRISTATGLNIIMGAGYYKDKWIHDSIKSKSVEQLTDMIINDIRTGINGIHAGVIGEMGVSRPIKAFEEKALRAAARAQKATGAAIDVHFDINGPISERHNALDILESEGADLTRVYISHCTVYDELVADYITLAQRGCYLAFDNLGMEVYWSMALNWPTPLEPVETIMALIDEGYLNQILISQDVCFTALLVANGGYGYGHIVNTLVPQFKTGGLTNEQIHTIMVENPKRILPFKIYTD